MPYNYALLITAINLLLSSSLHAVCAREDIQFYLDKGFTQEQVTQLCTATKGSGGDAVPDYTPYQQQVIIYKEGGGEAPGIKDGLTKEEREAVNILKSGGDVAKIEVTPETISYTAKTCVISVSTPSVNERYKDCVEVDFVVQRKDLVVSASGKKLMIGNSYVILEGTVDAKPKVSWDTYPIAVRSDLQRNFEWRENGTRTAFPIASDYSVTRMVNAFRTLANTYGQADEENQVAKASSVESEKAVEEPKKEKKNRWWNPFD